MSKDKARSAQSYENEELLLSRLPVLLEAKGFACVATMRQGAMKFVNARIADGSGMCFWL